MSRYGFVYVLGNECMPGIYKIGRTEKSPSMRKNELSNSTAVPVKFEILAYAEFENCCEFEAYMHERFSGLRVNQAREFFYGPIEEILDELLQSNCLTRFSNDPEIYLAKLSEVAILEERKDRLKGPFIKLVGGLDA